MEYITDEWSGRAVDVTLFANVIGVLVLSQASDISVSCWAARVVSFPPVIQARRREHQGDRHWY